MIKEKNTKNLFGDSINSINDSDFELRVKVLTSLFIEVLKKNRDLSDYFEATLVQMSFEAQAALFLKLGRWLKNQSNDFHSELNTLLATNKIVNDFEKALANWAQEKILSISSRNSRIRDVYAMQLFPLLRNISIPLGVIHQESHHANHVDMLYVCGMANIVEAKKIFEFGTYRGQTTCGLASVCKEAHIYTLNLPIEDDPRYAPFIGMYINQSLDRDRITQIYCDSRTFDTSSLRGAIDYIFIDGDHSYEGVKNDTEKALEMLRPGGLIVWHDYAAKSPGVLEYLSEFSQERPLFHLRKTCLAVYIDGLNAEEAQLAQMDISLELLEYSEDI